MHPPISLRHPDSARLPALLCLVLPLSFAGTVRGVDKNGVAPQAISLPSGPGSIQGLGESFQPQLNTGGGSTQVKLALPRGPGGITPELSLAYNSGGGGSSLGLGWSLAGMLSVRRSTDRGVPYYVDGPDGIDNDLDARIDNPEELDTFTGANGEELVALPDGTFRAENEGAFLRYTRSGEGWEARSRDGKRYLFGLTPPARIEDAGRVFEWCLERFVDANGNAVDYAYEGDPASPAQRHLRRLRWGSGQAYLAAVLSYEPGRPDVAANYRSGFELKTSLRLSGLDVISHGIPAAPGALRGDLDGDGAGAPDALIRRYRFEYDPGAHVSLLSRVTQLGHDGATALPTLTYTYTPWTPPNNVAASVIRSSNAPVAGFDSPSVELIDMNGDGLPDLLSTAGNDHRVFINLGVNAAGRLQWAPGRPVDNAPTIDISSDKTHLADATADGLSDLMVKVSNTSFLCFDNTSDNAWVRAPFPILNTDTWPIWPYDGAGGALSRSYDIDYSRTNDILHTSPTGYQLWLLLPGGRYAREMRFPPLTLDGQVFRFDLPGTHIADLNGDRLQDLAWIQPTRVVCFPSRGRGSFAAPVVLTLGRTLSSEEIERSDFSDVDGDGLVDVTLVRPSSQPGNVLYWLNRFERGLEGPRTVAGLPAARAGDALRWADMNGNGTTDIVISQAQSAVGEKIVFVDLVPEGKTQVLREARNGLGRVIRMDYESSTAQMVRAAAAGEPWTTRMPVPTTVVASITEGDGRGPPSVQEIAYRDPFWDPVKQEFRGFARAESREIGDASAATKVTRFHFDTGREDSCMKGKQLAMEQVTADGTLIEREAATWQPRVLADGVDGRQVCHAVEEATDKFIHEGEALAVHVRSEADHDVHGNAIAERRFGVVDQPGDEVFTEREFDVRLAEWRLDLIARETMLDGSGARRRELRHFHDARGNRERTDAWLDSENRFVVRERRRFDAFGNVIEAIDARSHRRTIEFDSLLHVWPVKETIHLEESELVMDAEYDLGLGLVTRATDFHGQRTDYRHDALGRLVEQVRPGGAGELYEYQLGDPVSRMIKRLRLEPGAGATFDSHFYSDGYGRPLGSVVAGEDGRWRVLEAKAYNTRKLESRLWLPYHASSPDAPAPDPTAPHEARIYDELGRLVESLRPDGSVVRHVHRPLAVAVYDGNDNAQGGEPDLRREDGLGRLVAVEERNAAETYVTSYRWRATGELESIVDALGNTRSFRFDSLGRLVEMDDPDRGRRTQSFDDAGNLIERVDARGQITRYSHDAANRIVERDYAGRPAAGGDLPDAVFHYDEPAGVLDLGDGTQGVARHTAGRLAWVEDTSGDEHFSYDERGNIEWVLKRVRDPHTGLLVPYLTRQSYDLLHRETETIFPDNDRLRRVRGPGGFIERIDGGPQGRVVLDQADHAPHGQPERLRFGNGAEAAFEYDSSQRLKSLRVAGSAAGVLLDESITYDLVSNVIAIDDRRPASAVPVNSPRRRTASFAYDDLNRLAGASHGDAGVLGRIDYTLDALGNLLRQSTPPPGSPGHIADPAVDLGDVSYAGGRSARDGRAPLDPPGPHAITSTRSGRSFRYDANGNVTDLDGGALDWDPEDRLERFRRDGIEAEYRRDHAFGRVRKEVVRRGARSETIYIGDDFEVEDGAPVKYAFLDGRRLARITGVLDPGRERVQRLVLARGWNLVAAAVESTRAMRDLLGADAAVFEARGASYAAVSIAGAMPPGRALWVHAPSPRLTVLRGRALEAAESTSAGPLHAWPSLQSLQPAEEADGGPLLVYQAVDRRWLRRDPALPSFLNDAPAELGAARAFWSAGAVTLRPSATQAADIVLYHGDHLGTPAALSDAAGDLLEERAHYPYGVVRHLHRPEDLPAGSKAAGGRWSFTGKERDPESGLVAMGARSYLEAAGVFLSPDPRFVEAAALGQGSDGDKSSFTAFLHNPQMGNLYAHAARNPLKYVDPSGLEIVFSPVLRKSPVFQEALELFKKTNEGQRLLARIEASKAKVTVIAGKAMSGGKENLGTAFYEPEGGTVEINVLRHKKNYADHNAMILELADTIHHELRHAEGSINLKELGQMRKGLDWIRKNALITPSRGKPSDPKMWMGHEVHDALDKHGNDPLNQTFRQEATREQAKSNLQKQHPLFEYDLD